MESKRMFQAKKDICEISGFNFEFSEIKSSFKKL